ncbi:hypothetical protein [Methylococcus capsulatus]|uniref:hypothetical protein n=1 Tax=Methylococcus capsulatus TaxID=414 RepID=UPI001C52F8DB|nr:hypothetical protein [Methylococcus capsulatus]QXP86590.1 hypothetical protein KW112_09230 [Methylococcus capsulatus]QXP93731.1 hypothetical protein KW113_00385 [Methylococcus capsulatus]UQN11550.1 hypothetical protein M3M30_10975 [Methylococcus capsulatus]
MTTLQVENLTFEFPVSWQASKYDDWSFYRNQFVKQRDGIGAVDILAKAPCGTAYLIEVKDYRHPDTEKPSDLPQSLANKVLMTLAALLPARLNSNEAQERAMARAILTCKKLRVVAHVELPRRHMPVIDPADLKQKLAQLLRAVDAHPKVVSTHQMHGISWRVR